MNIGKETRTGLTIKAKQPKDISAAAHGTAVGQAAGAGKASADGDGARLDLGDGGGKAQGEENGSNEQLHFGGFK